MTKWQGLRENEELRGFGFLGSSQSGTKGCFTLKVFTQYVKKTWVGGFLA